MLVRTCAAPTVSLGWPSINEGEIDELLQRLAQGLGRVIAGMVGAERHMRAKEGAGVWFEEPGDAAGQRHP